MMEKVIIDTIQKYNLFNTDATLVVAVSGGADSMALLHVLSKLRYNVVVAHVNHHKREDAHLDAQLVKEAAESLRAPYYHYDLPKSPEPVNFQSYARKLRYEFFREVAKSNNTPYILSAHHGDDHLETLVHRFMHYQSASGLQGILPRLDYEGFQLVRPMLNVSKSQIYEYCHKEQIPFREDSSNDSDAYSRNRIRKRALPFLYEESPQLVAHARNLSDGIAEDEAYFAKEVDRLWEQITVQEGFVALSREWVADLPSSLSKRLLKRIWRHLGVQQFSTNHLEEALNRIRHGLPNEVYTLPGAFQVVAYDQLHFLTKLPKVESYSAELTLNSKITLPNRHELVINYKKERGNRRKSCINEVHLCYNEIELPLRVRTRKNGDRLALSSGGTKKVKEIMIEAKIPKHLRDSWPVITDANDRIIWLPLLKKADVCQSSWESDMITLEYRHHGGS